MKKIVSILFFAFIFTSAFSEESIQVESGIQAKHHHHRHHDNSSSRNHCNQGATGPMGPAGATGPTGPSGLSFSPSIDVFSTNNGESDNQNLLAGSLITLEKYNNFDTAYFTRINSGTAIQVLQSGVYHISFSARGYLTETVTANTDQWGVTIVTNSVFHETYIAGNGTSLSSPDIVVGEIILSLNANDIVELMIAATNATGTSPDDIINLVSSSLILNQEHVGNPTTSAWMNISFLSP